MRLLYALSLLVISATPLSAQEDASSPLVVPFAQFPPFLFLDEDGDRTGFIVDLAEMLGSEIAVPIEYLDVPNAREGVAAQASGGSQLLPGVLKLPQLRATSLFSREVAADVLRPAVLASNAELIELGMLNGKRVAVVPPVIGSADPVLDQNISVEFASPQEAVIALLAAKVDAVLLPPPVVYGIAREAGFDGRIAFIGDPLQSATRHIALHESRASLMPAINAAVARMEVRRRRCSNCSNLLRAETRSRSVSSNLRAASRR
ncbi:MAG: transporter substrate-binding domain-containing protein [Pseudomonadota bacterium]